MGQGNLARFGSRTAADQADIGDGVVRGAERSDRQQGALLVQHAADTEYLGGLDGFFKRHARQDGRDAAGQHGLCRNRAVRSS